MSLLSSISSNVRSLEDEETDHTMLQDLQLAAELGKTLLERNKELENCIKIQQSTIEEQAQEIEYMKKQTAALREVNDSRLKIYEQLEISIGDLERANHRLVIENSGDKKIIKSQCLMIESLEARVEELQKKIEELNEEVESLNRQKSTQQLPRSNSSRAQNATWKESVSQDDSTNQNAVSNSPPSTAQDSTPNLDANVKQLVRVLANDEETIDLLRQLQEAKSQRIREQKKAAELEQQLASLLHENSALEEQLNIWRSKAQDVKSLQDEISTLEEVRQGNLCGRCLRGVNTTITDELSVMLDQEEYDDISIAESFVNEIPRDSDSLQNSDIKGPGAKDESMNDRTNQPPAHGFEFLNEYRVLVQKYEALLEVQRHPATVSSRRKNSIPGTCRSLQEELEMSGEFNSFQNPSLENELLMTQQQETIATTIAANIGPNGTATSKLGATTNHQSNNPRSKPGDNSIKKQISATPTDFSEAETSSSGFSDETSNKATQTDGRPGSFLCSIADGEDCKFSIYDDNSPFESRFRKTPEYRQLFSEIFCVLKRAVEAKDEKQQQQQQHVVENEEQESTEPEGAVTISNTNFDLPSEATDDNQSVMSSVVSSIVSEPVYRTSISEDQRKHQASNETNSTTSNKTTTSSSTVMGSRLDYLSINVNVRKKSTPKKTGAKRHSTSTHNDRSTTPDVIPTTNPKIVPAKTSGRRRFRPFDAEENLWNGTTRYIYPQNNKIQKDSSCPSPLPNPRRRFPGPGSRRGGSGVSEQSHHHSQQQQHHHHHHQQHNNPNFEFNDFKPSTASEDVARLKRLEMSYAQVLRLPNKSKVNRKQC